MTEKEKVGIALRNLRTNNTDLNVSEVATKMGKQKVWLSELETGKKNVFFKDVLDNYFLNCIMKVQRYK